MKKLALIALLPIFLNACAVVGPGERGVRVSLGSVSQDVKKPGAYLWIPFLLGMKKLDVQLQKSEVESSASSKDMQEITTHVAVNWAIDPTKAVSVYQAIGDEDDVLERVITPAVNEVMKAAAAKRTAEEILTKRMEMKKDIDDGLKERLEKKGVSLDDVSIVNLTFSKDFSEAIERKQIAEQEAKQAEYVAQKAIQQAKADVERAKGQAQAQQLVRASITHDILMQKAIEKWDGHFPQVMSDAKSLPFIKIGE